MNRTIKRSCFAILISAILTFSLLLPACKNHWMTDLTAHMYCQFCGELKKEPHLCLYLMYLLTIANQPTTDDPTINEPIMGLTHITANYTGTRTIYTTTPRDKLKDNLAITAFFDDGTNRILGAAEYALSGTLTAGTSVITVLYGGRIAAFYVTVTASIIEMARINAGFFRMGSPDDEPAGATFARERPQHQVTLTEGFYMGKYPITQGQYDAVMGTNPSEYFNNPATFDGVLEIQNRRPVETVSWYETLVFCNKLSIEEGLEPAYRIGGNVDPDLWGPVPGTSVATWNNVEIVADSTGYRLPTEAQWEFACRAGTDTAYNTGSNDITTTTGWYDGNSGGSTRQVGLLPSNKWGLYDMHGNVTEWCFDWHSETIYTVADRTNPVGADSGPYRVHRGGAFHYGPTDLRSAFRNRGEPEGRHHNLGFRVVRP